jgi:hypothetical protein
MSACAREHVWAVRHGTPCRFGMTTARHHIGKKWVTAMGLHKELRCIQGEFGRPPGQAEPRMRDLGSPGCTHPHGESMRDAAACAARH